MGQVVTFYSYKGGTGRSMALANIAWHLATNGYTVLVVDWDLEAPGLHRYFRPFLADKELIAPESKGLIEFVTNYREMAATPPISGERPKDWYEAHAQIWNWSVPLRWPTGSVLQFENRGEIRFVPAGRLDQSYASRVNTFDWQSFYQAHDGGRFLKSVREQARKKYDYVLIDSRTGVSDTSGICTIDMPDVLIACYTYNVQSVEGASDIVHRIVLRRPELAVYPVAMRADNQASAQMAPMRKLARARFGELVPATAGPGYFDEMVVGYFYDYSAFERLAAFEEFPNDAKSINQDFGRLASMIAGRELALPTVDEDHRNMVNEEFQPAQGDGTGGDASGRKQMWRKYRYELTEYNRLLRRCGYGLFASACLAAAVAIESFFDDRGGSASIGLLITAALVGVWLFLLRGQRAAFRAADGAIFMASVAGASLAAVAIAALQYVNPLYPGMRDATVIQPNGEYWAAGTSDSNVAPLFPITRSADLVHWTRAGFVLGSRPPWANDYFWAPHFFVNGSDLLVYMTAGAFGLANDGKCIAVAKSVSGSPIGLYTQPKSLVCDACGFTDPAVYRLDDGLYLVYRFDRAARSHCPTQFPDIMAHRLTPDGMDLLDHQNMKLGDAADYSYKTLLTPELRKKAWDAVGASGPAIIPHGQYFYLFYTSGQIIDGPGCDWAVGVARSAALTGPYERYDGNPILKGNDKFGCPGQIADVVGGDGMPYALYSAQCRTCRVPSGSPSRALMLDRISWDKGSGDWPSIAQGTPSVRGSSPAPLATSLREQVANVRGWPAAAWFHIVLVLLCEAAGTAALVGNARLAARRRELGAEIDGRSVAVN